MPVLNTMDLNQQIANNVEDILGEIGITEYTRYKNRLAMTCPVHCGDNNEACSIFTDCNKYVPNWKCFTHGCHEGKSSLTSLLCLLLEKNFKETIAWLKKFGIEQDQANFNKDDYNFVRTCKTLTQTNRSSTLEKLPAKTLDKLDRPVNFYLDRGFKQETLEEFNIGICREKGKFFYNRIVVPIFEDRTKEYVLGCVGRTLYPECPICNKYHYQNISCVYKTRKWTNSKNFNTNSYLYNYWNASDVVKDTGKLYIVEGQADVWRFWEAGIKNVVGLFGVSASDEQQILLEKSGATDITLFLDPDEAGENAYTKFVDTLSRFYSLSKIESEKQPSECNIEELRKLIGK